MKELKASQDLANRAHKNMIKPNAAPVLESNTNLGRSGLAIQPQDGSKKPVKLSPNKGKGK